MTRRRCRRPRSSGTGWRRGSGRRAAASRCRRVVRRRACRGSSKRGLWQRVGTIAVRNGTGIVGGDGWCCCQRRRPLCGAQWGCSCRRCGCCGTESFCICPLTPVSIHFSMPTWILACCYNAKRAEKKLCKGCSLTLHILILRMCLVRLAAFVSLGANVKINQLINL